MTVLQGVLVISFRDWVLDRVQPDAIRVHELLSDGSLHLAVLEKYRDRMEWAILAAPHLIAPAFGLPVMDRHILASKPLSPIRICVRQFPAPITSAAPIPRPTAITERTIAAKATLT